MLYRLLFNHWLHSFLKLNLCILFLLNTLFVGVLQAQNADQSAFSARLINLEGSLNDPFRFQATLTNTAAKAEIFQIATDLPEGWRANFTTMGSRVTSVQVEAGAEQEITMEVFPSPSAKPGNYKVPLRVNSPSAHHELVFQVAITGTFDLQLTTPNGRVSNELVSGSSKSFVLTVKNTGSLPLADLEIGSRLPSKWEATFDPIKIDQIPPGQSSDVQVHTKVPEKTIAGDYMAKFTVKNANKETDLDYRLTVKTSILSGWIGILVIALALALVYYLIRKYGRR
ncbi:MAG: COG1470 family protein [Sphingobacterium sp.]